jgi:hypothetical protein
MQKNNLEKCYGVAARGKNDCAEGQHSCVGQATHDRVLGLLTRPAILVLFGMTAVIQLFVYPEAWPTHLQWAAMMLVLLSRGAGKLSLDHLLWRRLRPKLG